METLHLMLAETPNLLIAVQRTSPNIDTRSELASSEEIISTQSITDISKSDDSAVPQNEQSEVVKTDPTLIYSIKDMDLVKVRPTEGSLDIAQSESSTIKSKIKILSGSYAGAVRHGSKQTRQRVTETKATRPNEPIPTEIISTTKKLIKMRWPAVKLKATVKPAIKIDSEQIENTRSDVETETDEMQVDKITEEFIYKTEAGKSKLTTIRFRRPGPGRRPSVRRRNRFLQNKRRKPGVRSTTPESSTTEITTIPVTKTTTPRNRNRPRVKIRGPFRIRNRFPLRGQPTFNRRHPVKALPPAVDGHSRSTFNNGDDRGDGQPKEISDEDVHLGQKIKFMSDHRAQFDVKGVGVIGGVKIQSNDMTYQKSIANEQFERIAPRTKDLTTRKDDLELDEKKLRSSAGDQLDVFEHDESPMYNLNIRNRPSDDRGSENVKEKSRDGEVSVLEINRNNTSCSSIFLRICRPLLAYDRTSYPNMFLHQNEGQLRVFRRTFRRGVQDLRKCHKDGVALACAMLQPKCNSQRNQLNMCASLCNGKWCLLYHVVSFILQLWL